jgi:hypothetical protein
MRSKNIAFLTMALGIGLASTAYGDLKVKSKYTSDGQTSETTVYTKGGRQRLEPTAGIAIINQNDLKRSVQLLDQKKAYLVISADTMKRLPQPAADGSQPTGGVVNYTINITDTGEKKQLFGYTARHVKSVTTKEAAAGACDSGNETIETDGWYIDYEPETTPASGSADAPSADSSSSCHDDVHYKQTGTGKLGYPLAYSLKTTKADGKNTNMAMEVVDFSTASLDSTLFEVPADYTELSNFKDLGALMAAGGSATAASNPRTGSAALNTFTPKTPGTVRVGVADPGNRSGKSLGPASAREQLIAGLVNSKVDAIAIDGTSPAEFEEAAKKTECDYILYTDVADVKKSSGGGFGKLGGMLNKASSVTGGTTKEKVEAKVDYKLLALGTAKPFISASASGSNGGGFNVGSAVHLATSVGSMAMFSKFGMFGMLDPNMMRALSNTNGIGGLGTGMRGLPGMPRGGLDPSLSPFLSVMQTTQSMMSPSAPTEEAKAVTDALNEAAKNIAEALKKKK